MLVNNSAPEHGKESEEIFDHYEILELVSVGGRKLSFQLPPLSIAEERQD